MKAKEEFISNKWKQSSAKAKVVRTSEVLLSFLFTLNFNSVLRVAEFRLFLLANRQGFSFIQYHGIFRVTGFRFFFSSKLTRTVTELQTLFSFCINFE